MRFLTAFAALLLTSLMVEAQEPDAEKTKGRRVWLATTHLPKGMDNPATVMVGKKFHEVILSKRRASTAIPIKKEQTVRLVRRKPHPDKPDEVIIEVLAQAVIPETTREALIILIPLPAKDPNSHTEFIARVQNLAKYRGGDYLFLNLTPTKIAVELGGEKLGIGPGETTIYDASTIKKSSNAAVRYYFFDQAKNKWQLISASTIVVRPKRREMCIFSWNERYKRISYHGITFPVEP